MAVKTRPARARRRLRDVWPGDRRSRMIVVLAPIALVLFCVLVPVNAAVYGTPVALALLLGAAAVTAPLVSLWYPKTAIALFTTAAALAPLVVPRESALSAPWPWSVPMLIAFGVVVAAVTLEYGWRLGLVQYALGSAAGVVAAVVFPAVPSANTLIVTTAVVGGVYLLAVLLAGRMRVGAELTRERELTALEQSRRLVVEERTRIARELHDVVAHGMSLIQVQASTAKYRVPGLPDEAAREFDEIAQTARTGLAEMRRLLGVLRTDDQSAELVPQQGLRDIPALVETVRRAGADLDAIVEMPQSPVPDAVDITAFRIVQEALSNAVRHAPGAPIVLRVETDAVAVRLLVRNAPPRDGEAAPAASGAGHGLIGMGERAALVGGSVDAAADADGGWTVSAVLPVPPPAPGPPPVADAVRPPAVPHPPTDGEPT
ncbi:sensor histidine kinase [Microbacterium jejuense]|uniref:histidine kinase n=1 Tax=Microbacterium jejuense TaxID=1263637 RepID=A0ABS7HLW8_9MICO|nr:histidine kinase [Microbacterium jejuense]MBW9093932.1 sensor histidine kinase [Microbacterium jejuense]